MYASWPRSYACHVMIVSVRYVGVLQLIRYSMRRMLTSIRNAHGEEICQFNRSSLQKYFCASGHFSIARYLPSYSLGTRFARLNFEEDLRGLSCKTTVTRLHTLAFYVTPSVLKTFSMRLKGERTAIVSGVIGWSRPETSGQHLKFRAQSSYGVRCTKYQSAGIKSTQAGAASVTR